MIDTRRLAVAVAGLWLSGCLYGSVDDATTGAALSDVTVQVVSGTCSGTGCTSPNVQLTSDGIYVFDAYGNYNGDADVQLILPAAGEETVQFAFSKPGTRPTKQNRVACGS